jgi:hypothetical protein
VLEREFSRSTAEETIKGLDWLFTLEGRIAECLLMANVNLPMKRRVGDAVLEIDFSDLPFDTPLCITESDSSRIEIVEVASSDGCYDDPILDLFNALNAEEEEAEDTLLDIAREKGVFSFALNAERKQKVCTA